LGHFINIRLKTESNFGSVFLYFIERPQPERERELTTRFSAETFVSFNISPVYYEKIVSTETN